MSAPAKPGDFTPAATVDLTIDFDDADDDYRRIRAEQWCVLYADGKWLRRTWRDAGIARFEFELERTLFCSNSRTAEQQPSAMKLLNTILNNTHLIPTILFASA
jgi:hypothetical protein